MSSTALAAYVPQDRLRALASGIALPNRSEGTVIFADISGFTTLTAGLSAVYGARQGAGELSRSLGRVYEGLIEAVERWNGSVISFAGDAILCWFDAGNDAPERRAAHAHACALEMQAFLAALEPVTLEGRDSVKIALKVAMASGTTQRFLVGHPEHQTIDLLTGDTVTRCTELERLAASGEIRWDEPTARLLGSGSSPVPPPRREPVRVKAEHLRRWVLPAVWDRETAGLGRFLPEFRPTVALFLRFTGLDYEDPATEDRLNQWVGLVQSALHDAGGTLLHVEIGDKGSYLYGAFGAPVVHADDARRSVRSALRLRALAQRLGFLDPVQIGLSRGIMRTGAYGAARRGCYSALGDEVNIAARLMEHADPGEILMTGRVMVALGPDVALESLGALPMKGIPVKIPSFRLVGDPVMAERAPGDDARTPLVGRQAELQTLLSALEAAREGRGSAAVLLGDAGIGKTRLSHEVLERARGLGFTVIQVGAESEASNEAWHVWRRVWRSLFGPEVPFVDTQRLEALEPRDRKSQVETWQLEAFRARAHDHDVQRDGLLVIIQDAHAIDRASQDLFFRFSRQVSDLPVVLLATSRPSDFADQAAGNQPELLLTLHEMTEAESQSLVEARVLQVFGAEASAVPDRVWRRVIERAGGNPFFLDELVRFFHYRGFNLAQPEALLSVELPDSVHALILGRLDLLDPTEQSLLKCAALIGIRFATADLAACFPELGTPQEVDARLTRLTERGFLQGRLWLNAPYQEFRHPLVREAIYDSIDSTARAELHDRYAQWLLALGAPTDDDGRLEALAHHFVLGENRELAPAFLRAAGESAARLFNNARAITHFERLLRWSSSAGERLDARMRLVSLHELVGNWQAAQSLCVQARAETVAQTVEHWQCLLAEGRIARRRGDIEGAKQLLEKALAGWVTSDDRDLECDTRLELANLALGRAEYTEAGAQLAVARGLGVREAQLCESEGILALMQRELPKARRAFERTLELAREAGNQRGVADALNNLARSHHFADDYDPALTLYEESLAAYRAMGDRWAVARTLNTQGMVAWNRNNSAEAERLFRESLATAIDLGDKAGQAKYLNNIGTTLHLRGDFDGAGVYYRESLELSRKLGDRKTLCHPLCNLGMIEGRLEHPGQAFAYYAEARSLAEETGDAWMLGYVTLHKSMLTGRLGNAPEAWEGLEVALETFSALGNDTYRLHTLAGFVITYVRNAPEALGHPAARRLSSHVVGELSALKARLESEFQGPWDQALAQLAGCDAESGEDTDAGTPSAWLTALKFALFGSALV